MLDGHVHVHDCFEPDVLLRAASRNLGAEARRQGAGEDWIGVLLLSESHPHDWFHSVAAQEQISSRDGNHRWRVRSTFEPESLRLENANDLLFVVAGRQIVTRDDLEVLALATDHSFAEGAPLHETVGEVLAAGGVPVIPWGFGKWWGRRGRLLRSYLEEEPAGVFLGDNGGRPAFAPPPALFRLAKRRGIAILPGSDPLPFPSEVERAGSTGFTLCGAVGPDTPARDLRAACARPDFEPRPFGAGPGPLRFARLQLVTQWRKQRGGGG